MVSDSLPTTNFTDKREGEYIMFCFGFNNALEAKGFQFSDQFMNLSVFNSYTMACTFAPVSGNKRFFARAWL